MYPILDYADIIHMVTQVPLVHETAFQLLVGVILSAQSTDKKVNEVTDALFRVAPDAGSMASTPVRFWTAAERAH